MTLSEWCQSHDFKEFLELMDDFDGPEQEAHPLDPEDEDPGIAAWRERCRKFKEVGA